MNWTDWHNCYDGGWKGIICDEAFAHPAKFSRALIQRIIAHGLERDYWKEGDTIADPFGGVALGGIAAGYQGLNWIGVELEPRFVEMGNRNLEMHGPAWLALGKANVVKLVQGDSRRFAEIVGDACGIVSSPPWQENLSLDRPNAAERRQVARERGISNAERVSPIEMEKLGKRHEGDYGKTPGQIGALPAGDLAGVVTSPPYNLPFSQEHPGRGDGTRGTEPSETGAFVKYGSHPGQIEGLPPGDVAAVVTSPPYADTTNVGEYRDPEKCNAREARYLEAHPELVGKRPAFLPYGSSPGQIGALPAGDVAAVVTSPPFGDDQPAQSQTKALKDYHAFTRGDGSKRDHTMRSDGNIANEGAGETYFQAVAQVYAQCGLVLRPGGVCCLVLKDYVKNKTRVPLCDQTCELLTRLGFEVFERTRCWLVKETKHNDLFDGAVTTRKERKSFFRRLAEKKGAPRIDFEEAIWARCHKT